MDVTPTDSAEFVELMTQFYRGERGRATTWRTRLDHTTDWAVILSATLLTWAFSDPARPHYVILVGMVMVLLFLAIEAHRYRVFDVWRSRVRILEENLFAPALDRAGGRAERSERTADWCGLLGDDLRRPTVKTPWLEAVHRRLQRVYFPMLAILFIAWLVMLTVFEDTSGGIIAAANVGQIPGVVIVSLVVSTYVMLLALTVWPMERHAKGELTTDEHGESVWKE
jgi:uncharacterized membrane protein